MLEAGYVEDWKYFQTYSGTPQGGILSPLLANIVLNELDTFVEETLIPQYTKGKKRRGNKENQRLRYKAHELRKQGNYREGKKLYKIYSTIPSVDYEDPNYRRLRYVRYADDFLLGFIGTKAEAETIKEAIRNFLEKMVGLTLSQEKTFITHASKGKARFLSYDIQIARKETRKAKVEVEGMRTRRRSLNGQVIFLVCKCQVKSEPLFQLKSEPPQLINSSSSNTHQLIKCVKSTSNLFRARLSPPITSHLFRITGRGSGDWKEPVGRL